MNSFYIRENGIAFQSMTQNLEARRDWLRFENNFYIIKKNFINKADTEVTNWGKYLQQIKREYGKGCPKGTGQFKKRKWGQKDAKSKFIKREIRVFNFIVIKNIKITVFSFLLYLHTLKQDRWESLAKWKENHILHYW